MLPVQENEAGGGRALSRQLSISAMAGGLFASNATGPNNYSQVAKMLTLQC